MRALTAPPTAPAKQISDAQIQGFIPPAPAGSASVVVAINVIGLSPFLLLVIVCLLSLRPPFYADTMKKATSIFQMFPRILFGV
jgi:hypothetical protein